MYEGYFNTPPPPAILRAHLTSGLDRFLHPSPCTMRDVWRCLYSKLTKRTAMRLYLFSHTGQTAE